MRVTDQPTEAISGRVLGGIPEKLVLYVNGEPTDVIVSQRAFVTSVPLQSGLNELRAVVKDASGLEAEDTITVQYVPRQSSTGIALTSPADGLMLSPDDPPVVVVEGQIEDKTVGTAWIVVNERRIPVPTRDGRFRQIMPVSEPVLRLWAETPPNGGTIHRSQTLTVYTTGARATAGILVMDWPQGTEGSDVEVSATWRAHPERLDTSVQTVRLAEATKPSNGVPSEVFYLRGVKPGVYTVIVRYRGSAPPGDVRPTLYLPDKDRLSPRALRPVRLNSKGGTVLTKVLMPYGILWEQDDWFSGVSESVDTVTKFRVPEGISWVERKADLP